MINVRYPGYQVAVQDKGKIRSTGAVPYLHGGIVGTVPTYVPTCDLLYEDPDSGTKFMLCDIVSAVGTGAVQYLHGGLECTCDLTEIRNEDPDSGTRFMLSVIVSTVPVAIIIQALTNVQVPELHGTVRYGYC